MKVLFISSLIILNFFIFKPLFSQDTLSSENLGFKEKVLSKFWDKDISRWSVRGLANFKDNKFRLRNQEYILEYTPNNPSGIGFGIANSKLIVDIIFNIKSDKENITNRFDMQGDLMFGRSYVLFQFQNYQGYNVRNKTTDEPGIFRRDIETSTINLQYFFIFNSAVSVMHSIFSGVNKDYRSAGTFVGGIFIDYHKIDADSSIVPLSSAELFNKEAQIVHLDQIGGGINFGYSYLLVLPANFLINLSAAPGIGLSFKNIETETNSYMPKEYWQGSVTANIQLGYNGKRIYAQVSAVNTWFYSPLGNSNVGSTNSTKAKLTIGYKFLKHN